MSIETVIHAFQRTELALVSHRIPKKMLVEQGAATAADKGLINNMVVGPWWHAALKPAPSVCWRPPGSAPTWSSLRWSSASMGSTK